MSAPFMSDEQLAAAHARRMAGESWFEIAGTNWRKAQKLYSVAKTSGRLARALTGAPCEVTQVSVPPTSGAGGGVEWAYSGDGATVSAPFGRIGTLAELLAAADVDLTRWYIDRWTVNSYEMAAKDSDGKLRVEPLRKVQAWLRPVPGADVAAALRDSIIADMAAHAPRYAGVRYAGVRDGERHMLEVCPFDLHIGMLAWGEECGTDFDSEIAERVLMDAVERLLRRATAYPIERVLLPLGNDWLHADSSNAGAGGITTRGTVLDVDTRYHKMFSTARRVAVRLIDELRQVAPVETVIVPGNHDSERMFYIGEVLEAWYRNDDAVTVDNRPTPRKYKTFGSTLLGFTHGHQAKPDKLPLLMATEASREWADATTREWHCGHLHRTSRELDEYAGVRTRVIPSLAAEDAWHTGQGYRHTRAMEAFVWHESEGLAATFNAPARDPLGKAA